MKKKNKTITLISILTIIMLGLIGVAYAYSGLFTGNSQQLVLGDIYMNYTESNVLSLANAMPSETYDTSKYFEFTINGKNTYNQDIYYEIVLNHGDNHATRTERIQDNLLKFTLVEIKDNTETIVVDGASYEEINNTRIWVNTISKNTNSNVNITYRLYMWVSDETTICGGTITGCSYDVDTWNNQVYSSIKVNVNGDFSKKTIGVQVLSDTFKSVLTSRAGSYILEDKIYYVSGKNDDDNVNTKTDIDFNYIWYSGKLWRIVAINADGGLKLITQNNITAIDYGEDNNFYTDESTSSSVYQWLNEDFLDTLYNYKNIIKIDSTWNATTGDYTSISTKLPETTMVNAKVGILNSYEYYKSYENLGTDSTAYSSGYLNNGYAWWLLNETDSPSVTIWHVKSSGKGDESKRSSANGLRPVINLKSTIEIKGGSGSKSDPYRIKGDKEDAVANLTLLNTRISGEYVNFDGEKYRIVGIESNITKLNKVDYVRNESNTILEKYFASTYHYGLSTNTQSDDYWDYYLNNTWYNNVTTDYKNMLEKGVYYLGNVSYNDEKYKSAICKNASNTVSIKDCEKTTSTWSGYVGIPRFGEMFSSQLRLNTTSTNKMWLITPYNTLVRFITSDGSGGGGSDPTTAMYSVRPSINLKSRVIITGGTGLENDPFEIRNFTPAVLPIFQFEQPYITGANTSGTSVANVNISNSNYVISKTIPDEVEYINIIDVYALHQQNYISGGTLSSNYYALTTNYLDLIDINFCNVDPTLNPSICNIIKKEELNYLADKWISGGGSVETEDSIKISYNNSDKKLYIANGMGSTTFYLAIQYVVPGHQPSEWEHFTNYTPCLHSNTIVYVYDKKKKKFKKKKIKDVDYEDLLLVWDFDKREFAVSKPVWIKRKQTTDSYNLLTFSDGSTLKTINQHRIFNKEKGMFTLCMTDDTPIGTTTFNSKGEYVKLISKEIIYKEVDFYNVWTNYHINLFTDNILTSCRFSNLYKIEDMKYIVENRDNSDYISRFSIKDKWIKGLRLNEQPIDINIDKSLKFADVKEYIKLLESLDINNINKI